MRNHKDDDHMVDSIIAAFRDATGDPALDPAIPAIRSIFKSVVDRMSPHLRAQLVELYELSLFSSDPGDPRDADDYLRLREEIEQSGEIDNIVMQIMSECLGGLKDVNERVENFIADDRLAGAAPGVSLH